MNGAAKLWHPMGGLASPPSAATSKDSLGILSQSTAWIASQRDSLAAILAQQEKARASEEEARDRRIADASMQSTLFDQLGCSLKTAQESEPADLTPYWQTYATEDIPRAVESLPRLMLEHPTCESVGICLRTGPTLTKRGNYNYKGCSPTSGDGLATFCKKLLPTLCATDYKSPYSLQGYQKQAEKRSKPLRDTARHTIGISLTPGFCEWWMGWPIGASALNRSETHGCHSKPLPLGACSADQSDAQQPQ
jgi:hypothetical protein